MKTAMVYSIGLALVVVSSVSGQTGDPAKLIGTKKCAMCHKKAETGDQYGVWQTKVHAKAYEMLASEEAKAVGAKLGIDNPQTSGETTYTTLQVNCESCHGPGADYKKKSVMESREASIAAGMIYPAKEKSCTLCHNDTGPTWNPERYTTASGEKTGFDVVQAYEKIKHERPAK